MTSSKGFQHHFNIISKFVCCGCYMKKNAAFALISFAVLKWHECLSFQLPFELTVEIPVQLHLELEVNLLVRNVIEREIKREKVQMKPPIVRSCYKTWLWMLWLSLTFKLTIVTNLHLYLWLSLTLGESSSIHEAIITKAIKDPAISRLSKKALCISCLCSWPLIMLTEPG